MYFKIFLSVLLVTIIYKSETVSLPKLPPKSENDVITDFDPEQCRKLDLYYEKHRGKKENEYFPGCVQKKGQDKDCSVGKIKVCAPGLKCALEDPNGDPNVDKKCIIDETSCMRYEFRHIPVNIWKPTCLVDGTYAPKQCKGESENGRCFCYDAYGKRIFGQAWSDKAEDMTCACSRRRSELERDGRTNVTLHCDQMGNYEPLQCDSGLCWCAEPKTGEVVVQVVPETMMKLLPCYDKKQIGDQYLRQCESQALAQSKIREELLNHGTKSVPLPFLLCDYDGSYGKYSIKNGIATCTLRDNKAAGQWSVPVVANLENIMNCNCAKDTIMYQKMGQTPAFLCEGNGNYQPVQHGSSDDNYCVDSDGFPTTIPVKTNVVKDDCPVY